MLGLLRFTDLIGYSDSQAESRVVDLAPGCLPAPAASPLLALEPSPQAQDKVLEQLPA